MLVERSELLIKAGVEDDFAAVMNDRGLPILKGVPGVVSVQMGRGVENPSKFILLVEWETMDAHTAFKSNPVYPEFGQLFGPYAQGGTMEHFEIG
jgi:heme-degrading monooxygenase HmoA